MTYPTATIETNKGSITIELWDDVAPKHAENFQKLAKSEFYDGLIFHRVIKGFMIQGGCPDGTGMGNPGWTVNAEFSDREHHEGVLSMARSQDPNSAGSQFFICLDRCPHLDGQYTAFGQSNQWHRSRSRNWHYKNRPRRPPCRRYFNDNCNCVTSNPKAGVLLVAIGYYASFLFCGRSRMN